MTEILPSKLKFAGEKLEYFQFDLCINDIFSIDAISQENVLCIFDGKMFCDSLNGEKFRCLSHWVKMRLLLSSEKSIREMFVWDIVNLQRNNLKLSLRVWFQQCKIVTALECYFEENAALFAPFTEISVEFQLLKQQRTRKFEILWKKYENIDWSKPFRGREILKQKFRDETRMLNEEFETEFEKLLHKKVDDVEKNDTIGNENIVEAPGHFEWRLY